MGQGQGEERASQLSASTGSDAGKSPEQLRAEIEQVRASLGDTAAALAAKTDVKARARDKAEELKRTAATRKDTLIARSKTAVAPAGDGSTAATPVQARAGSAMTQLRERARRNPVQSAVLGAFAGGFALGRLTVRRP